MKVVDIGKGKNQSCVEVLKATLEMAEKGEIVTVGIAWVTDHNSIGGDVSDGDNNMMTWAALEHIARSFYDEEIRSHEDD